MKTLEMNGTTVEMNDEGFLLDASQWTPEIGEALARESGLALGDQHLHQGDVPALPQGPRQAGGADRRAAEAPGVHLSPALENPS